MPLSFLYVLYFLLDLLDWLRAGDLVGGPMVTIEARVEIRRDVPMMRRTFARVIAVVGLLLGAVLGPGSLLSPNELNAQVMSDYTAPHPYINQVVPPNILLIVDNSGSLKHMAYGDTTFNPATTYTGLFEPTECYKRNSSQFEPDPAADPSSPGTCSATYPWSGNLLNYATMRRIDIVKRVMTGGTCSTTRDTLGYCPAGSSNYIKGQDTYDPADCCWGDKIMSVTVANATGRVPATVLTGLSGTLYFHLLESISSLQGTFCLDNETAPPTGSDCGDADGYNEKVLEAKFAIRVQVTSPQGGVIQQVGDQARLGLMTFNISREGAAVKNSIGANLSDILSTLDAHMAATWTQLAESLYEAVRYYAQLAPFYSSADYTVSLANDPYYFQSPKWASTAGYVDCCKSYVILFTDGEPTEDLNIPAALQDYGHSVHGAHCTTDPDANPCTPHKEDYPEYGSHYLDDVAYYAHTTDLRQATLPVLGAAGKDLAGFQNLTVYTFFAWGGVAGRDLLQSAAKAGGFEDSNNDNLGPNGADTPDLVSEWDKLNNLTGAAGADGIPDTYFESSNANDLKDRLLAAIYSVLKRSASGTAASVLASSSTGEGTAYQAYFYPASSDISGEVKWTGYLHSMWVDAFGNFREDTDGDGKQIYQSDKIVVTRYDASTGEVLVDRYDDANGDGKADSTSCNPCGKPLKDLAPVWEAGKRLALTDPANRKILTWADLDYDGFVDAGEQIPFTTANSATLSPYILAGGGGVSPFTANNIINFIRGEQLTGLRNRQLQVPPGSGTLKVWKLGDIINSTPVIVGPPKERYDVIYGDSSYTDYFTKYKTRRMVAYVGANDGMLHAFNAGFYHRGDDPNTSSATEHGWFTRTATDNSGGPLLSEELWGFIPYHLLPQLQWLTREDYFHSYYVDLKPKVTDARIFTADTDHPNGWGTILIGGFRLGGSCKPCNAGQGKELKFKPGGTGNDRVFYSAYFVLDITNPEVDPKLLWVFTDELLQMTTSYPTVLRVNPHADAKTSNTNAKWFVLFGSGPSGYTGASEIDGHVFIVDLKVGPGKDNDGDSNGNSKNFYVEKNPSGGSKSFIGDMISLDANLDYRTDVMYFGANLDTGGTPKWEGKLYRLTTSANQSRPFGGDTTPADWGYGKKPTWFLFDFGCSPSPGCSGPKKPGPVLTAPTVTLDDSLNVWVFVGTGRFWTLADKSLTETQYFFGLKDDVINGTCTQGSDKDCLQKDLVNVSKAVVCSTCAGGTNQVTDSNNTGVTTLTGTATTSLQGLVASKEGWYTTLLPASGPAVGERVLASPTLFGGIVFFPTFIPEVGTVCSGGTGNSSLYALFYLTGSAYKTSVVGTDTVGGNTNVKRSTALGAGVASQVGIHMGAQGTDSASGVTSRSKACSQMSTGALTCIQTQPALVAWSRYLSWISLRL
jgi:type IV pilus assembly protein PilY1